MIRYIITLIPLILFTNVTYVETKQPFEVDLIVGPPLEDRSLDSQHMFNLLTELKNNKEKLNKLNNK